MKQGYLIALESEVATHPKSLARLLLFTGETK
jgi:hypothetical protein